MSADGTAAGLAKLKFAKVNPFTFTEHGAIQAANVLNSEQAVEMGVYVVRAFVRLRAWLATQSNLIARLDEPEEKTEQLALAHETFSRNTRLRLKQVFEAVRVLMTPPRSSQAADRVPRARRGKPQGQVLMIVLARLRLALEQKRAA